MPTTAWQLGIEVEASCVLAGAGFLESWNAYQGALKALEDSWGDGEFTLP